MFKCKTVDEKYQAAPKNRANPKKVTRLIFFIIFIFVYFGWRPARPRDHGAMSHLIDLGPVYNAYSGLFETGNIYQIIPLISTIITGLTR